MIDYAPSIVNVQKIIVKRHKQSLIKKMMFKQIIIKSY